METKTINCPDYIKISCWIYYVLGAIGMLIEPMLFFSGIRGLFHWDALFRFMGCVGIFASAYLIGIGHRHGRHVAIAAAVLLIVNIFERYGLLGFLFSFLIILPIVATYSKHGREWLNNYPSFSSRDMYVLGVKFKGLRLWQKILFIALSISVVFQLCAEHNLYWEESEYETDKAGTVHEIMIMRFATYENKDVKISISPRLSFILVRQGDSSHGNMETKKSFDFESGSGFDSCKEYIRSIVRERTANQVSKRLDKFKNQFR